MSITVVQPSLISQWVLAISSQLKIEHAFAMSSAVEAAFYGSIRSVKNNTSPIIKSICATTVEHFNSLQLTFNILNGGMILFSAKTLGDEIRKRSFNAFVSYSIPIAGAISLFALGCFAIKTDTKEETSSLHQKIARGMQITQIALNTILACVSSQGQLLYAFSALGAAYNFFKNFQIKWLNFSRTFDLNLNNPQVPVNQATVSYRMLMVPGSTDEICAICQVDKPDTAFCIHHLYHKECIKGWVVTQSDSFLKGSFFHKRRVDHYHNGVHTETSYHYDVIIPHNNLPNCPECRAFPRQNGLDINVKDRLHGNIDASVNITYPDSGSTYQTIFEKFNTAYSVVQAGFAYLQTHPHLATSIFRIQKFLLVTDVIALTYTYYYLYQKVSLKFKVEENWAKVALASSMIGLTVISYVAVSQLSVYWKSAICLKDVLSNLPVSPEILKDVVSITWNAPLIHKVIQTLYLNRAIATFALAFFSTHKRLNLTSAVAQVYSLFNISMLPWIEIVKRISDGPVNLTNLKAKAYFMTYPGCLKDPSHLASTVKSIVEYMHNLFKNSSWYSYWNVTYQNGVEIGRRLVYEVTPKNLSLEACRCSLKPYLGDLSISAYNILYKTFPSFNINLPSYFF